MQITHDEARRLIQINADQTLQEKEQCLLDDHLKTCLDCRGYAEDIHEVEAVLVPMLQRRWNQYAEPYTARTLPSSGYTKITKDILLFARITAMGIICAVFLFNIWQFTQSSGQEPISSAAMVPPVPTPSLIETVSTKASEQNCQPASYFVQEHDTLKSVAEKFSVTTDEIAAYNNLRGETLFPSMRLEIPLCGTLMPGTTNTVSTMFTPLINTTTSTPISGPTQ